MSADKSLCCCVDASIKSVKLATFVKLLLAISAVAIMAGGIVAGVFS